MKTKSITFCVMTFAVVFGLALQVWAENNWADVLCSYEQGLYANDGYTDPQMVFTTTPEDATPEELETFYGVSLGWWVDDPNQGNGVNPVGIMLGFSTSILNGEGNDLKIQGNALPGWWEPGYVEVARETSGIGATVDGWTDEDWYLLKPSNYDDLPHDPRTAPVDIAFNGSTGYEDSYWSDNSMTGYADVSVDGDCMDISWAMDIDENMVELTDIAYIRIRSVSNSPAGILGGFTTEVDYVEYLNGVVELSEFLLGDANGDGLVGADDYAAVQGNFGASGAVGGGLLGDANGDGLVGADDYAAVQGNFGASLSAEVTPEPATLSAMLLVSAAGLLKKRKRY